MLADAPYFGESSELILTGVIVIAFAGLVGWAAVVIWRRPQAGIVLRLVATLVALLGLALLAVGCLLAGCGVVLKG